MFSFSKAAKDPTFKIGAMIVALTVLVGAGFLFLFYKSELDVKQTANEIGIIRQALTQKARLEGMRQSKAGRSDSMTYVDDWDFTFGYPKNFFLDSMDSGVGTVGWYITSQKGRLAGGAGGSNSFESGYEMNIQRMSSNGASLGQLGEDVSLIPTGDFTLYAVDRPACDGAGCPQFAYYIDRPTEKYLVTVYATTDFEYPDLITASILSTFGK